MPEVVGDVCGEDDVMNEIQYGFVVSRAEVLKHIATFSVEDAQSLSEVVTLKRNRASGERKIEEGERKGGGERERERRRRERERGRGGGREREREREKRGEKARREAERKVNNSRVISALYQDRVCDKSPKKYS